MLCVGPTINHVAVVSITTFCGHPQRVSQPSSSDPSPQWNDRCTVLLQEHTRYRGNGMTRHCFGQGANRSRVPCNRSRVQYRAIGTRRREHLLGAPPVLGKSLTPSCSDGRSGVRHVTNITVAKMVKLGKANCIGSALRNTRCCVLDAKSKMMH